MRFIATELYVEKFRLLQNQTFKLGKKITVFSGQNGVGKSNILSLIASTFGKNTKKMFHGNFQPEFFDYFSMSENEEFSGYLSYLKVIENSSNSLIQKRHAYKNDTKDNRGIRFIPRTTNRYTPEITIKEVSDYQRSKFKFGADARIPVPTIFLTLARLFPVGETKIESKPLRTNNKLYVNQSYKKYIEWYNYVLTDSIKPDAIIKSFSKTKIESHNLYVDLNNASETTQSVGQDNLSHIISTFIEFYNLKLNTGDEYNGGILCIDEVDASLHPSAQLRLFNLMDILCEQLDLQIFLTTHSLTILKEIIKKSKSSADYSLNYLVDPNNPHLTKISSYEHLKADLFDVRVKYSPEILIYCEDNETQFIFSELIKAYKTLYKESSNLPNHKILSVHLGCNNLKSLPTIDKHFHEVLIVLDGDTKLGSNNHSLLNSYINDDNDVIKGLNPQKLPPGKIICLPTFLAPESYLYFIIYRMVNDAKFKPFWNELSNIPETMYYTLTRIKPDLLDTINLTSNKLNDDLKSSGKVNEMKTFIKDTQAFANYYKEYPEDLNTFFSEVYTKMTEIQHLIKSKY